MSIDTEIRHVTRAGANLFLELGFSTAETKRLHAASRKQINDTRGLKQQLMVELSNWITEHQLKQADAAQVLMMSRPRVLRCGEPEDREVHDRHAGRDAQPRG